MAQKTFREVWNQFLLYAPGTPVALAQQMVRNAYQRALNMHQWSELIRDAEKVVAAEYSDGTVAVTNGSTTITGTSTTWTSAMTGRQIQILDNGKQPYYTFTYVSATSGTLDRAYQGPTDSSSTYTIGEFYVEFPSDLDTLDDIRDLGNNWRLCRQHHQQNYLDLVDAQRNHTGAPRLYVAAPPRISSGVSYPRYEFYPRIAAGTHLVYRYSTTSELTSQTSYLITMLQPEAVVYGALAELALWPSTPDRPNPFHSIDTHREYNKLFEDTVHDSEMADLERAQRMLMYPDEDRWNGIPDNQLLSADVLLEDGGSSIMLEH